MEDSVRDVWLTNVEVFLFVKKKLTERAYYRGTSKITILFQLDLILQKIEMEVILRIQVIYVSGTQNIAQGNDG